MEGECRVPVFSKMVLVVPWDNLFLSDEMLLEFLVGITQTFLEKQGLCLPGIRLNYKMEGRPENSLSGGKFSQNQNPLFPAGAYGGGGGVVVVVKCLYVEGRSQTHHSGFCAPRPVSAAEIVCRTRRQGHL